MLYTRHRRHYAAVLFLLFFSVATPFLTACGSTLSAPTDPALAAGWTWYHDSTLPFQIPVPPGWQMASLYDGPLDNEQCIYAVDFFPPGVPVDLSKEAQIHEAWLVKIRVFLTCPPWQPSDDKWYQAESKPITVSGTSAIVYDNANQADHIVVTTFGGHQYIFAVHSYKTPSETKQVYSLFDQMLHGFQYQGP